RGCVPPQPSRGGAGNLFSPKPPPLAAEGTGRGGPGGSAGPSPPRPGQDTLRPRSKHRARRSRGRGPRPATARCSTVPIGTAPVDQASGIVEAVTHADATVDDQDQTTVTAALGPGLLDTRPVQRTTDQLGTARSGEEQSHRQQSGHCAECGRG